MKRKDFERQQTITLVRETGMPWLKALRQVRASIVDVPEPMKEAPSVSAPQHLRTQSRFARRGERRLDAVSKRIGREIEPMFFDNLPRGDKRRLAGPMTGKRAKALLVAAFPRRKASRSHGGRFDPRHIEPHVAWSLLGGGGGERFVGAGRQ
jgi:hypothetical protein